MRKILSVCLFATLFVGFTACEKENNETAEKLDGNWKIEKITKAAGPVDESSMPLDVSLEACKVNRGECDGNWVSNNGDEAPFHWTVADDGQILSIIPIPDLPSNQATSDLAEFKGDYDIVELTDVKLVIKRDQITIEFSQEEG